MREGSGLAIDALVHGLVDVLKVSVVAKTIDSCQFDGCHASAVMPVWLMSKKAFLSRFIVSEDACGERKVQYHPAVRAVSVGRFQVVEDISQGGSPAFCTFCWLTKASRLWYAIPFS